MTCRTRCCTRTPGSWPSPSCPCCSPSTRWACRWAQGAGLEGPGHLLRHHLPAAPAASPPRSLLGLRDFAGCSWQGAFLWLGWAALAALSISVYTLRPAGGRDCGASDAHQWQRHPLGRQRHAGVLPGRPAGCGGWGTPAGGLPCFARPPGCLRETRHANPPAAALSARHAGCSPARARGAGRPSCQ